jgi:thiamine biosynthesis lipoprotein
MLTYHQSHIALGSHIDLVLTSDAPQTTIDKIFRMLWFHIFTCEQRFSRFLPNSELTQFNRMAGTRQLVSSEFHALLQASANMANLSNGIYNPFILPALQRAGYTHSMVAAHRNDVVDNYADRTIVPADQVEIGGTWAIIPYGTAIDFGGCGKGYEGDQLADLADSCPELDGYWFSLGGDIVANGVDDNTEPWIIHIENTASSLHALAGKVAPNSPIRHAVATSSVTRRKGVKHGKPWHHIIDPRTWDHRMLNNMRKLGAQLACCYNQNTILKHTRGRLFRSIVRLVDSKL